MTIQIQYNLKYKTDLSSRKVAAVAAGVAVAAVGHFQEVSNEDQVRICCRQNRCCPRRLLRHSPVVDVVG